MNTETAKKCFDALRAGGGRCWDCRVLTRDGSFKANAIQLTEFPQIEKLLKLVEIGNKSDNQHAWDLDLTEYSQDAVLELLRFVYLSETANLTTESAEQYLAEEVWSLATELDLVGLQQQCVEALKLALVTIAVDEDNFLRLSQLAGEMKLRSLLLKCSTFFKTKFVADPASAIAELREQAPAFLNAAIRMLPYRIPVADNAQDNAEQGVVIDPHSWDDNRFEEVVASLGGAEAMERNLTDFQIHCTDAPPDRPIRCHRDILSRVPHFERMFLQDNDETREGFVRVKAEKEVVMEILKYLYSGCTNDLSRTLPQTTEDEETFIAYEVINLAQQYGMYKLKQEAHEALLRCDITHSNVLDLLGIAVLYELTELTSKCLRYVFDSRQTLLTTDQWKNADNTALQAVSECVFIVWNDIENFYVWDDNSLWTVGMNGTKSSKIKIDRRWLSWQPVVQLDDRTVMHLLDGKQAKLFDLLDHSASDCSPSLLFSHGNGSGCLFNGDVYVTGGSDAKVCERYNRATNTWERVADMNRRRYLHTLVLWKGSLLAIGGYQSGGSIERYDAVADRWEVILESEGRLDNAFVRAAVINNELWVYSSKNWCCHRLWKVDLDADEWVEIPVPTAADCEVRIVTCMFEREGKAHLIAMTRSDDGENEQTKVFSFDEATGVCSEVLQFGPSASRADAIPIICGSQ